MRTPSPLWITPASLKTFASHLYNVGPTSSTLVQHCTNVIQMFRVCWGVTGPRLTLMQCDVITSRVTCADLQETPVAFENSRRSPGAETEAAPPPPPTSKESSTDPPGRARVRFPWQPLRDQLSELS